MVNRRPLAAAVLALSVLATACGARVDHSLRQQAADALLNGSGGASGAGGSASGSDATGSGANVAGGPGGTGVSGAGTTGTTKLGAGNSGGAGGGAAGGGAAGGAAKASGCGGGTGPGLTATTMTVGNVSSLTGPVPGLFAGAVQGTQAFAQFANSQGGICGHQLQVKVADDGTDCQRNQSATADLAGKVFAFLGSFSLYDNCGAGIIGKHAGLPDLSNALSQEAGALPNNFAVEPLPLGYATGMFTYYAQKYGDKVKHVGTLYPDIPSAAQKSKAFENSAQAAGWHFDYERAHAATETDWTTDFVKMCHANPPVQIFFTSAENATNAAKMVNDEKQAGCSGLVNIIPIAYDQAFVSAVGDTSAIEGLQGWNLYSLFFNQDEAARIPELGLLQQWFARVYPGKPLNLYALFAWAEGRLLQQAMTSAGPNAGQSQLMAALRKIHKFDAGGIIAPADPNSKTTGPNCYVLWQFKGGKFERVDTPATGYRCDGTYLRYNG